jgi:hypothetical protein
MLAGGSAPGGRRAAVGGSGGRGWARWLAAADPFAAAQPVGPVAENAVVARSAVEAVAGAAREADLVVAGAGCDRSGPLPGLTLSAPPPVLTRSSPSARTSTCTSAATVAAGALAAGTSASPASSWATSSPASRPAYGARPSDPPGTRRQQRRARCQPSATTRPAGSGPSATACSAPGRSMTTPTPTTAGASVTCSGSSPPAGGTRSTANCASPLKPTGCARRRSCAS